MSSLAVIVLKGRMWLMYAAAAVFLFLASLFSVGSAHASYSDIKNGAYDWGSYYNFAPSKARVLQAITDTADAPTPLTAGEVLSGYIEAFPSAEPGGELSYFLGRPGEGLIRIDLGDPAALGVDPAALVGQYVAFPVGTVADDGSVTIGDSNSDGTNDIVPAPPPTDPVNPDTSSAPKTPLLSDAGVTPDSFFGLGGILERLGETIVDSTTALFVSPEVEAGRLFRRVQERAAEAEGLARTGDAGAVTSAAQAHQDAIANLEALFTELTDEKVAELEQDVAVQLTALESSLPAIPPSSGEVMKQEVIGAIQGALDEAADARELAPVPFPVVERMHALQQLGLLSQEQVAAVYQAGSRSEARTVFENFAQSGILPETDLKRFDVAQQALYPEVYAATMELYKLEELKELEVVRPPDDILAKLREFGATYIPGTPIPADLLPHWLASVRLEELQQTARPDLLDAEVLRNARPEDFAKLNELRERFRPSPADVVLIEQYRASNPGGALPPALQRIQAFQDKFGLKPPEGWKPPEGLSGALPFLGPGGTRTVEEAGAFCTTNASACSNFAPPSGFTFNPQVGVRFTEGQPGNAPPSFAALGFGPAFRPPVPHYFVPDTIGGPRPEYTGPNGCKTPEECLQVFQNVRPEERAGQFGLFVARPRDGEEPRDAEGRPMFPAGASIPVGAPFRPDLGGFPGASYSEGPAPYYPPYVYTPSGGFSGEQQPTPGSYTPPPSGQYVPPSGGTTSGGDQPPPPPPGGTTTSDGYQPPSGDSGGYYQPPSGDSGGSSDSGGSGDGGGGGEALPPPPG